LRPYPIMLNVQNRTAVVVGGGNVALRKTSGLLACGAKVVVIAPELKPEMHDLASAGKIQWIKEEFREGLLDLVADPLMLFGTTNNRETNVSIYRAAAERKILCNIADVPDLCTFIVPAVITQGDLMIAVSTGGASPALAKRIREDLQKRFGPEYAQMTKLMGELRKEIIRQGKTSDENKRLFGALVNSELLEALRAKNKDRVFEILTSILPSDLSPESALEETANDAFLKWE
jgi:precorrin-2 dehydrogenase/sirohydrochlorin ferrochelatase